MLQFSNFLRPNFQKPPPPVRDGPKFQNHPSLYARIIKKMAAKQNDPVSIECVSRVSPDASLNTRKY